MVIQMAPNHSSNHPTSIIASEENVYTYGHQIIHSCSLIEKAMDICLPIGAHSTIMSASFVFYCAAPTAFRIDWFTEEWVGLWITKRVWVQIFRRATSIEHGGECRREN